MPHDFRFKQTDILFSLVDVCHSISSKAEFMSLVYPKLMQIFPHAMFGCAIVDRAESADNRYLNVGFPKECVDQVAQAHGCMAAPLIEKWHAAKRPVYYDRLCRAETTSDSSLVAALHDHRLVNLVGHGIADHTGEVLCYFAFAGFENWDKRQEGIVNLVAPLLHVGLSRAFNKSAPAHSVALSKRQQEILEWIRKGKSNGEIAELVGISPWTVKIHVRNLMAKLDVSRRSQAISKAFEVGLLGRQR